MTRHAVLFTSRGPSVYRNVRRAATGEMEILLDQDAVSKLTLDFTHWLQPSETISSATASGANVTVSTAVSSPNVTLTLSAATSYDLDGAVTVIATSSTGEKWRGIVRVRRTERYMDEDAPKDYA